MKNDKNIVADFINYMCDWAEQEYKEKEYDSFRYMLRDDRLSYLVADKGIEKRIQKKIRKKLNLKSKVIYRLLPSPCKYCDGELYIKLLKREQVTKIQIPRYFQEELDG